MKAVILAGGLGTRISEETGVRPKPMVEIGGKPILWHIMKIYSAHGINDFVICLGYKGYVIKEYFANYYLHASDVTFDLASNAMEVHQSDGRAVAGDAGRHRRGDDDRRAARARHGLRARRAVLLHLRRRRRRRRHRRADRVPPRAGPAGDGDGGAAARAASARSRSTATRVTRLRREAARRRRLDQRRLLRARARASSATSATTPRSGSASRWSASRATASSRLHARRLLAADGHAARAAPAAGAVGVRPRAVEDCGRRRRSGAAGASSSPATPASRAAGWRSGCSRSGAEVTGFSDAGRPSRRSSSWPRSARRPARPARRRPRSGRALRDSGRGRGGRVPPGGAAAGAALLRGPARDLRRQRHGHGQPARGRARRAGVRVVVVVTTDKCYENREWEWAYREDEPLGGAGSLLAPPRAARSSSPRPTGARSSRTATARGVASARAGNVIGGGDWGEDRLVPDVVRAALAGAPVAIRNPSAIRPWQHVLNPLSGYLVLAAGAVGRARARRRLELRAGRGGRAARALDPRAPGGALAGRAALGSTTAGQHPHEAHHLQIDSSRARARLGWRPGWNLDEALDRLVDWYAALQRRRGHARGDARPDRGVRGRSLACPAACSLSLPVLRRSARAHLRRPRDVPAGELLRRARARERDGAVLSRCTRSSAASASSCSSRSSRRADAHLLRLRLLLVVLDELARARRALRRGDDRALRPRRPTATSSSWPPTTATCCSTSSQRGMPVLGVEPAANVAEVAEEKGVPTEVAFFGVETAEAPRARPT